MTDADQAFARQGAVLAAAVEAALPAWSVRVVTALGGPELTDAAARAGSEAAAAIGPELRSLLAADVDAQQLNPLALVRRAVVWPSAVLREAGVAPVERDEHDRVHFPDDDYGLTPRTFGDVDPGLQDPGILWGALKARAHLERHRAGSA